MEESAGDPSKRDPVHTQGVAARKLTIADLTAAPYNPRTIKDAALGGLAYSLEEFGDISGLTYNTQTGNLVTGHQRMATLRHEHGDALELIAESEDWAHVSTPTGERFMVRLVSWDLAREKAANLAANSPEISGTFTEDLASILDDVRADLPDLSAGLLLDELLGMMPMLPPEVDESIADGISICRCPKCDHEHHREAN